MKNIQKIFEIEPLLIGENIRKWRELKCIKQQSLADRLGITSGAMSNIENNKTSVNLIRLQQIASYLDMDIMLLFSNPLDLLKMNLDKGNIIQ